MMKRLIILMTTVGLVFGMILGYYAGGTWWSYLLAVALITAVAFTLKLVKSKVPR